MSENKVLFQQDLIGTFNSGKQSPLVGVVFNYGTPVTHFYKKILIKATVKTQLFVQ